VNAGAERRDGLRSAGVGDADLDAGSGEQPGQGRPDVPAADDRVPVWRSLMAMQDGLTEFIERRLRRGSGLSNADYQVLAHLSEAPAGRLRSFELGGLLRWEKSRLSQHLGRMEKRDLVARERCETDQRGAVVALTPRGRELIEAAAPQHVADVREVLVDHLTAAELEMLGTIGEKVRARLAALELSPLAADRQGGQEDRDAAEGEQQR
jgi:DNA-binding MarR family transcriptional regulator